MLGISGRPVSDGTHLLARECFGIKCMSIGFLIEDSKSAVIWRGPMLHAYITQFLKDVS